MVATTRQESDVDEDCLHRLLASGDMVDQIPSAAEKVFATASKSSSEQSAKDSLSVMPHDDKPASNIDLTRKRLSDYVLSPLVIATCYVAQAKR